MILTGEKLPDDSILLEMIEAVAEANKIAKEYREDSERLDRQHKDDSSPVTQADKDIEETVYKQRLWRLGGSFEGEEYGRHGALAVIEGAEPPLLDDSYEWLTDPIDGTGNYSEGTGPGSHASKSEFATCIVLCKKDNSLEGSHPVKAVVGLPATNEIYVAAEGQGAYVIRSDGYVKRLNRSLDAGKPPNRYLHIDLQTPNHPRIQAAFNRYIQEQGVTNPSNRYMGSSISEIIHVASGSSAAYVGKLARWDYLASLFIAHEAGAKHSVERAGDGKSYVVISQNPEMHKVLVNEVQQINGLAGRQAFPRSNASTRGWNMR